MKSTDIFVNFILFSCYSNGKTLSFQILKSHKNIIIRLHLLLLREMYDFLLLFFCSIYSFLENLNISKYLYNITGI